MQEERISIAGHELVLRHPGDSESLIDEQRFEDDEFLPYWAELWPSGLALARHVVSLDLTGTTVLELGCGLGLPSFAAVLAGAEVLATDWAPEAIELIRHNAEANGLALEATVLAWDDGPSQELGRFELVLASDVLYEDRNAAPLLRLLDLVVAPGGEALVADPGRRHAAAFFVRACETGWVPDEIAADGLPRGRIVRLRRREG